MKTAATSFVGNNTSLSTRFYITHTNKSSFMNQSLRKTYALAIVLIIANLFFASTSFSQAVGDYRSVGGNWGTLASWQRLNALPSTWATPTSGQGYPGQNAVPPTVTILNGTSITMNVSPANHIGALVLEAGNAASSLTFTGSSALIVDNAITYNSGTGINDDRTIAVATGSLSAASVSIPATGNDNRGNFLSISSGSVTVTGNITMAETQAARNLVSLTASGGTLTVGGTITSGALTNVAGSTVIYTGGGAQTVRAVTYAGNVTLAGSGAKTLTGATINGTLSMQGTATATGAPTLGAASTLEYKGTASQSSGSEFPATVVNLRIDNTNGVILTGTKTVSTALTFVNGKLTLGTNDLTVSGSITGASTSNYVVTNGAGQLNRVVAASAVAFPVGNSSYNPITFTNSGTSDTYGVNVLDGAITTGNSNTKTVSRRWQVTEAVANGSNLAVVAQYNSGEEAAGFNAATAPKLGFYNGTTWTENAATAAGSNPFTYTSNANFALGSLTTGTQYFAIGKDDAFIASPTKFVITSISPASPSASSSFSVTVQAQNAANVASIVSANTAFTLSTNGNAGAISGNVTGTILAGTNSIVVTGVVLANAGTGVTITATRTSGDVLTAGTSASFTVTAFVTAASDYFRSNTASGNYTTAASWQSSHDNVNWATATLAPTSSATAINIRNGHTIFATAVPSVNNLTVEAGGTYEHRMNGNAIPTATWNVASTCLVTGVTSTVPTVASLGQTFGNFTWNCTGQSADLSFASTMDNVQGNLTIISTGSPTVRILNFAISGGGTYTFTVGGSFIMSGGSIRLNETNGATQMTIAKDFTMTGGTITRGSGTGSINFNGTTTQVFTKAAGVGTISGTIPFTINNGATVDFGATNVLDGTTATFTVASGGTIITANTNATGALTTTGANGSIQVGGTRTYTSGANYIFNGTANQVVGNALSQNTPATVTIANTGTAPNNIVTSSATAFSTSGALNVNSGNFTLSATNANYAIGGNLTIASGATLTHNVNWGTTLLSVAGNWDNSGTYTYPVSRAHVQLLGAGTKSIKSNGSAFSILTLVTGTYNPTDALTINDNFYPMFNAAGTFNTNGQTVTANAACLSYGGALNINGGALNVTGGLLIGTGAVAGTVTLSSGTLTTDGISLGDATSTVANTLTQSGGTLQVNGGVTINQPNANNITNSWNINAQTATVTGAITFAGTNATASRVGRIVITTGTLNANGGISFAGSTAATKVIEMSTGGATGTLNLKGALTSPASATLNAGTSGSIFNYADNATAQTVGIFGAGAYHNLHINTTGGVGATLAANITTTNVTGNLRVQSGTLNNGGFAIAGNAARTFQVANAAFFQLGGTTSAFPTGFGTVTLGATSTVDYRGSGAQTIAAQSYGNLTTSLNGTRNITLASTGTIGIAGVFTPAVGGTTYTNTGSTVAFNGTTGAQNIPAFAFNNLTINNTSDVNLTGNVSVNGTTNALTFTNGKIITGVSNILTLASGVTVTTAGAGKYVYGNQAWNIPTGTPTRTFYIGDASNYTPATIAFTTSVTTGGVLTAASTAGDHFDIGNSGLDATKTVNRYWSFANSGIAPVGFSATFNFIGPTPGSGDIDAGVTTSSLIIKRYESGVWSSTTAGSALATSTSATGITGFGDFQIGQVTVCVPPTINTPVVTNVSCNGNADGSISITTTGGTGPFTYLWSNGQTFQNISGLAAGNYNVTITANGGCTVNSGTITVTEPTALGATVNSTNATCGNTDATITFSSPTGGSGSYEYTINGGTNWSPSGLFTGLAAGNYNVQMRDAATPSCVIIFDLSLVIVQQSTPNAPTSGGNQSVCYNGDPEQTITATATSPATITWYDAASGGNLVSPPSLTGVGTVTYYAQATSGACVSPTRTAVTLTIQDAPVAPVSGGDETVCSNGDPMQTLIATASSPATISWFTTPSGGSAVTPALIGVGTATYYAEASNGTCTSPRTPVTLTINPVLATPGTITGPLDVCPLVNSVTPSVYSIDPVPGATFYTWHVPVGATIVSGQGTTSLSVTFDNSFALTNSIFSVTAESLSACTSGASSIEVEKIVPEIPAVINGPTDACPFIDQPTNAVYSIAPVANATSYTWTVSGNATIVSGQGSTSIQVSFQTGFTTGSVKVTANSNCGNRAPRSLGVTRLLPNSPAVINGPADACPFIGTATQVVYSVDAVPNALSYTWTVPANVVLVNGQGSTSITVTFSSGYTTGLFKVRSVANCASSGDRSLSVAAAAATQPGVISGPTNACAFIGSGTDAVYTIRKVAGATSYNWAVPAGASITSHPAGAGVNDTIINVSFNNSFVSGTNISVQAVACIASAARTLSVTRILPSTPGLITGATNACPFMVSGSNPTGTPQTYTIRQVATATSYIWTAPSGATITAHPGGAGINDTIVEITYSAGFASGSVTVVSVNDCGQSAARTLAISKLVPGAPGTITAVSTSPCPGRQFTYTIPAMPSNAISVVWSVPAQGTIQSGQGTTSITVSYTSGAVTGTVTATGSNNCANGTTRSLNVNLAACIGGKEAPVAGRGNVLTNTASVVADKLQVNVSPNPTVTDFKLQVLTPATGIIHVRILDMQGRSLKNITVQPYQSVTIGSDLKAGSYLVEVTQGKEKTTQKLLKF